MSLYFGNKTVLLGVCASVAAYKSCEIASRLVEQGATVLTAFTKSARQLVQPAALEAITGNRAIVDMFTPLTDPEIEHIAVAQRADLFLIAPATANMLAKAAHGIADDWLSTTLLATRAPVLFAPAMNTQMYTHPATQMNIALLRDRGALFVGPAEGRLACGTTGIGRLADIPDILDAAAVAVHPNKDFSGKRILISSGPNHEPIDPVRFIGNRSSGKMGRALALEALRRGAEVCVVSGPATTPLPHAAEVVQVTTAEEMYAAVMERAAHYDVFIAAAAVADYRIDTPSIKKIKRDDNTCTLTLKPNPDIVAAVAAHKGPNQRVVGFAAESHDTQRNGQAKLEKKKLDLVVANTVGGARCAVGADQGDVWIISADQPPEAFEGIDKGALAARIFDRLHVLLTK